MKFVENFYSTHSLFGANRWRKIASKNRRKIFVFFVQNVFFYLFFSTKRKTFSSERVFYRRDRTKNCEQIQSETRRFYSNIRYENLWRSSIFDRKCFWNRPNRSEKEKESNIFGVVFSIRIFIWLCNEYKLNRGTYWKRLVQLARRVDLEFWFVFHRWSKSVFSVEPVRFETTSEDFPSNKEKFNERNCCFHFRTSSLSAR